MTPSSRKNAPNPPSNPLLWKRLSVGTGGHKQDLSGSADDPNIYTVGILQGGKVEG